MLQIDNFKQMLSPQMTNLKVRTEIEDEIQTHTERKLFIHNQNGSTINQTSHNRQPVNNDNADPLQHGCYPLSSQAPPIVMRLEG